MVLERGGGEGDDGGDRDSSIDVPQLTALRETNDARQFFDCANELHNCRLSSRTC